MAEHFQIVLQGVSFNHDLFKKELKKSLRWLGANEADKLKQWVLVNYLSTHKSVIAEVFHLQAA